jgi:hypothetical protein
VTSGDRDSARDTVDGETPAALATSKIVGAIDAPPFSNLTMKSFAFHVKLIS